ncbi:hypothetical protein AQUCO_00100796v1 [Aquilegia coerulea]|uniref:Uncharacterized protein n=1 Tax=Aquilegia coerulea TaxID=218851 RepID=A0A2G5FBZ0_AQUCA|nr:hypothetical protein AQUCO_00100796v1 [Aquilegia coerulea]
MASNTSSQNISNKAGKVTGQAQAKKDELMDRAGQATGQAQTGEQVMHMAQGAADAVKNTLGMQNTSSNTTTTNNPNPMSKN